jgi:general secretion pathway protein I
MCQLNLYKLIFYYMTPAIKDQWPKAGVWRPEIGSRRLMIHRSQPGTGDRRPVTIALRQVTGIQIPTIGSQQPENSIQYPASSNPQTATRNPQPATRNPQLATRNSQRAPRIQHPVSGFTLLEVLIAMAIMAIVLVSVYRLHSQTLSMTAASRFYTQAPMLAQSKMSQLEANPSDLIAGDSGDFGEQFAGYSWRVSTEDVSSEVLGEAAGDLKRIDLTVALNENEYEYSVRTYLFVEESN